MLKWINIATFVLTVVVNGLAGSTTLIGGVDTAQISDANPTLITPAGYVFAIWGAIYVLLGIFVVFQALPSQEGKEYQGKISWLFVLGSLANIIWLFLWQYEYLSYSIIMMLVLLMSLILIYLRLGIGKSNAPMLERLAVHLPFSVYLGWITIATIANIAVTAVSVNWDGFGINPEIWAILILLVAHTVTMLIIVTRRDIGYTMVIIWALVGIAENQSANPTIVLLAQGSATIVAILLVATVILTRLRYETKGLT